MVKKENNQQMYWFFGALFVLLLFIGINQGWFTGEPEINVDIPQSTLESQLLGSCLEICDANNFDTGYLRGASCRGGETKVTYGFAGEPPISTCCCYDFTAADLGDCTDTDGLDIYTPGHATFEGLSYYDDCAGNWAVKEYSCSNGNLIIDTLGCDPGFICTETGNGDYCMSTDTGLEPGDEVGSGEGNYMVSDDTVVFDITLSGEPGDIPICAEIERSSTKVNTQCNPTGELEDWVEFALVDSFNEVWRATDRILAGQAGGVNTFGNPDVVRVYWNGEPFHAFMTHFGNCPMSMRLKVTIVVCE